MSVISDLVERLRSLLFRDREERELDEELRTHMEMEAAYRRRAGSDASDAERRSVIAFGGLERVKDDVRDARGTHLVEQTAKDIAFAARTLLANPSFTFVTLATLAVGIGGTTAVFSAVDAVLLRPLPYSQPGQLVRLFQQDSTNPNDRGFVTPVHFVEIRRRMSSFASVATIMTYSETGADIGSGDDVRRVKLLQTSSDYFDVLRMPPQIGRAFQREDETGAPVVVVSHALWKEALGGDPSAIGRTLSMSGVPHVVAGVMPEGFTDPLVRAVDAWVPIDLRPAQEADNAGNHYLAVVARLRDGLSIERAQAELNEVARAIARDFPATSAPRARLFPLQEEIVRSSSRALEIVLGAVGLVLVLVCVNVANLLLVRGSERAQEFAVRAALGAERARLARQMLIESLVLAIAGALAGLVVARLAMSAIVALGGGTIPRLATLTLDGRLLAFSLVVATASAALFGIAPAFRVARTQPGDVLRGQTRSSTGNAGRVRVREWLVVSQVSLAFVLLIGAGLLLSSFRRIQHVPLGVKTDGVFTFELHLPAARYDSAARGRFYEDVADRLAQIPGVRAAGGVSRLPATGRFHTWGTRAVTGPLAGVQRSFAQADQRVVSGNYFRAAGIPILKGRDFDARDTFGAPSVVLITQSLADALFPGVDPLGQTLRAGGRESQVIGIVGEVAADNEGRKAPYVYHAHRQWASNRNWALTQVVAFASARDDSHAAVRRAVAALDPQLVVHRPTSLDDAIGYGAAQRLFTLRILLTFAAVALVLAALGIYGVLSYGVRMRAREFGIRMALGAQRGSVRRMVLQRGLIVTGTGIGIGLAASLALSRSMTSVLFEVSPLDPIVYALAIAFMAIVALVSAYVPAHRATAVDPRTALQ